MKIPVAVFGATLFIAAVGFADDVNSFPVLPRLLLQALAVAASIVTAPDNLRIVPACPLWIERGLLLLAGLWFVNLVNFMDGLDLMTVAEVVPVTGAWSCSAGSANFPPRDHRRRGAVRRDARLRAVQPAGRKDLSRRRRQPADRPAAGWCLLQLAWHQQFAAALLLPLYYLTDATVTLLRRMKARAVLGGASLAFLPARHRQRLYGLARGGRSVRAQRRARRACDRLDHDLVDGHRHPAFVIGGIATAL